jgi:hypothetical protein
LEPDTCADELVELYLFLVDQIIKEIKFVVVSDLVSM